MSEANCPRCHQPLACGWWCHTCGMTIHEADTLARLEKDLAIPDFFTLMMAWICVLGVPIAVIAFLFRLTR